jgi:uncharacterized protein YkwD
VKKYHDNRCYCNRCTRGKKIGVAALFVMIAIVALYFTYPWIFANGSFSGVSAEMNKATNGIRSNIEDAQTLNLSKVAKITYQKANEARIAHGLQPLMWNDKLAQIAQAHSDDMARRQYFSHVSPDGVDNIDRFERAGMDCTVRMNDGSWTNGSENIVRGTGAGTDEEYLAERSVSGWMSSTEGHRENLLREYWVSTGIGFAIGEDGYFYGTQVFCNH